MPARNRHSFRKYTACHPALRAPLHPAHEIGAGVTGCGSFEMSFPSVNLTFSKSGARYPCAASACESNQGISSEMPATLLPGGTTPRKLRQRQRHPASVESLQCRLPDHR